MQMKEYWCQHFDYDDVQVIVFDFDGVIYSAPTYETEYANYLTRAVSALSVNDLSIAQAEELLLQHKVIGGKIYERKDIREICEKELGVLLREYDDYRQVNPFLPRKSQITTFSPSFLRKLSQKCKLIIVTNDTIDTLKQKMSKLNIDLSVFDNAYTPDIIDSTSFNKYDRYHTIINNFILHGTEIYVVGTNYHADIEPMIDHFGAGLLADPTNCMDTQMFLEDKFLGGKNGFI